MYFFCVSLCFSFALFHFLLFLCLSLFFFLVSFLSVFVISVSGSCFSFLFSLLSSFKLFFGFCCSGSCFVLSSIIIFHLFLLCIFCLPFLLVFGFACFVFLYFLILGKLSKTSSKKTEIEETATMKNPEKKDTYTRAVSTIVCTNSVFFLFLCFFNFCIFAENTIQIGVSAKKKQKKQKN